MWAINLLDQLSIILRDKLVELQDRYERGLALAKSATGEERAEIEAWLEQFNEAMERLWLALNCLSEGWQVQDIIDHFNRYGYVIVWSDHFQNRLAFIKDIDDVGKLPDNVKVIYTGGELRQLARLNAVTNRLVYEAKRNIIGEK